MAGMIHAMSRVLIVAPAMPRVSIVAPASYVLMCVMFAMPAMGCCCVLGHGDVMIVSGVLMRCGVVGVMTSRAMRGRIAMIGMRFMLFSLVTAHDCLFLIGLSRRKSNPAGCSSLSDFKTVIG